MKEEIINFEMTHKRVSLSAKWIFAENDGNGELTIQNPVSGSYGTLEQAFFGWSEQDDELNKEWGELAGLADEFLNIKNLYDIVNNGDEYELSEYV